MNALNDAATEALATALSQRDGASAQVLAQGRGEGAAQLASLAQEHNIPVLQDFALSQALQKMPVGTQIPEPLLRSLSALLDYLFQAEAELARRNGDRE